MIDKKKQYKTRRGFPVRIYATDCGGDYPVHGSVFLNGVWKLSSWTRDGVNGLIYGIDDWNLVEVKPRIQRTYYINVYDESVGADVVHYTRGDADRCAMSDRLACIEITIDCEEGEGL